jgi:thiol-disulfide isomerase/thioredoxin
MIRILFLLWCAWIAVDAQGKDKTILIRNASDSSFTGHLGKYRGSQWDTLRSVSLAPGKSLEVPMRDLDTGVYVMSASRNALRTFFVSKKEDVVLEYKVEFGAGQLKAVSYENSMLDSLDRVTQFLLMDADMIATAINQVQKSNKRYFSVLDSLSALREQKLTKLNQAVREFAAANTGSLAVRYLHPVYLIPHRSERAVWAAEFETEESFLLQHFWDYLYEANRYVTNFPLFYSKVDEYFFRYSEKTPDGLLGAGDKIVACVDHNPVSKKAAINHILRLFERNTDEAFFLRATDHFLSSCENEEAYADERKMAERVRKLQVGLDAPEITIVQAGGKQTKLSKFRGEQVVLIYWASWCPHCLEELPNLKAASEKLAPKNVRFVAISLDEDAASWMSTIESKGIGAWTHGCEFKKWKSDAAAAFNIHRTPTIYIIDADGKIKVKDANPKMITTYFE